ncbi:MAG: M48 family metallopeptidase [Deltaproteobacteria bacterium]|nr:M48 family metallopeptidase [Deltaproteobacteria bacterium]MBI3294212.1 M48 family metallopeptidase [Deltaproteobacteria bacterium]
MSRTHQTWPEKWLEHDRSIRPYLWSHRVVGWSGKLASLALFLFLVFDRRWIAIHEWSTQFASHNSLLQVLLYIGALGVLSQLIGLPFQFASYKIERHFKLSKQSLRSWIGDLLKGLVLGVVIGALILTALYSCYVYSGALWWLYTALTFMGFSVLLAQLAPVLLIPIFYKLEPLENSPLKERLLALCTRFQIPVKEVYHLGLGEKTEKGNAAFVGIGRTKRIIIGDTLYQKHSADEVEAVFAHELGHQVHNDLWKNIGLSGISVVIGFALSNFLLESYAQESLGLRNSTGLKLVVFLFFVSLIQIPLGQVQLLFSRWRERTADHFAASTVKVSSPLADSLERLTIQNKGQFLPNPVIEFLTYSHPAPWRRISRLRTEFS